MSLAGAVSCRVFLSAEGLEDPSVVGYQLPHAEMAPYLTERESHRVRKRERGERDFVGV